MLTVTLDGSGKYLLFRETYIYNGRLRALGARFDPDKKLWWLPKERIDDFDREFKGEAYYKTPLWVIKGENAPDYSKLYSIDPVIKLPDLKIPLYGYQDFGARFMIDRIRRHGFVINADGVGIGKTAQAIAVMKFLSADEGYEHFLIIGKKSIKFQWKDEIERFSDLADTYKIFTSPEGTKRQRQKLYEEASREEKSILITNYHNFLNDSEAIKAYDPDFCVIDEAHSVKARNGVMNNNIAEVLKGVPTAFLTGTPVMSRPEDIFGIIQISDPDYFGSWTDFRKRYLVLGNKFGYVFVEGVKHLDELHKKVQDVVIRRTEYEVSVQMPEVTVHNVKVDPSDTQLDFISIIGDKKDEYETQYSEAEQALSKNPADEDAKAAMEDATNGLKSLIAARQTTATDPKIFGYGKSKFAKRYAALLPKTLKASPKTEAVKDLVADIVESGDKVILFSKFVTTCLYFKDVLKKEHIDVLMYTGLEGDEDRIANIREFRESDKVNVLIGSDAMAEGLNLAEARHVINIDIPDTYAIYMQRYGRVRRVSSSYKNVVVHNIMTDGTVDIDKYAKIMQNKDLDGALVAADEAQRKALIEAQEK